MTNDPSGSLETENQDLRRPLVSREDVVRALRSQLAELTRGSAWEVAQYLQRLSQAMIPEASWHRRALTVAFRGWQAWRQLGLAATLARAYRLLLRLGPRVIRGVSPFPAREAYRAWMAAHEPGPAELARQRQAARAFACQPLMSILTPVYNPSPRVLRDTLESVRAQTYGHWELCLADGCSDVPGVRETLAEFARKDARIRVKFLDRNLGIAGNSNEALALAQGEFVALLDHDDLLSPDMLYEVVRALNEDPATDIIYFDEDKVSEDGRLRREPWFKPERWSPDLLLSTNYLMHSVMRCALLREVGGFDPQMDGAQDWDLTFRCVEKTQRLRHIPKVFYHWRQVKGSAARAADAKPWAFAAQARCIQAHLKRRGIQQPKLVFPSLGCVRVIWPISGAKVSIIIPTRDKVDLLRACLASILARTEYPDYEVILVDTGSVREETRRYYQELASEARVRIIRYVGPFNYSAANNLGAREARGQLLLFLNNDTEVVETDWLAELAGWAEQPGVGIVGCKLLRPDGTIQHAGIIMGLEGHGSHVFDGDPENHYGPFGSSEWYRNYQAVTGACMMLRRDVFEKLQGFDEAYQVGYSDIEICLRAASSGYRVVYTPFARLRHYEGGTRGLSLPPSDVLRAYFRMLPAVRAGDPFFSPNLSYVRRRPAVAQAGAESRDERLLRILTEFDLFIDNGLSETPETPPLLAAWREQEACPGPASPGQGKKLLLVTHDLSLSGAPLIQYMLAKHLAGQGYALTVLSAMEGPLRALYAQAQVEVRVETNAMNDARVPFYFMQDHGAVLVNTILAWRAVYAAKASGTPCLWWVHESEFGQRFARRNPRVAGAFALAEAVIFPSRASAALYVGFAGPDNYHALHSGLDLEAAAGAEDHFRKPLGKFCVVNLAGIEARKGQDVLVRSMAALPEALRSEVEVYLVGRILDRRFCKKLARLARSMKNVHLVGQVSHVEARAYLRAADVFVLPSRDEALPISMLEAMFFAKGIVAADVGGVGEVIDHGVNGLLFEADDHAALARHLEQLYRDRELLQRLGREAQAKFQAGLTVARFGQDILHIIQQMTDPATDRRRSSR